MSSVVVIMLLLQKLPLKVPWGVVTVLAKASKTALEGGDGNGQFNNFWQHAFYFHSKQYLSFS